MLTNSHSQWRSLPEILTETINVLRMRVEKKETEKERSPEFIFVIFLK